ncbi:hypothetical protein M569_10807, partial [Genlisea aurea]
GRVLREFSPEEVTANMYTMVDVLLHHFSLELQRGRSVQDIMLKAYTNLAFFIWTHELLPLDILLLALTDRDDDPHALEIVINILCSKELPQRVKLYLVNRGQPDHWMFSGTFKRCDLQKSLGNHLSWRERYPVFFDDMAARLLPVIPLIIYRLIENDRFDKADEVLRIYSTFLQCYPLVFTFVRDILAYFYGHLPVKLIHQLLNVLSTKKVPFSESFSQRVVPVCPPLDYFATILLGLVDHVIPPLGTSYRSAQFGDPSSGPSQASPCKGPVASPPTNSVAPEGQTPFYQIQDPGTYTQLILETAVIEILSLPVPAIEIVRSLVEIVVHIQPTLVQSSSGLQPSSASQCCVLPTSPSGGSSDSTANRTSSSSVPGLSGSNFVWRSAYTFQQLSCLLIQACGLLLAQLPSEFHAQLYAETARAIKESCWLCDGPDRQLDSAVCYALLDPTWAAQDDTSTSIGNVVALLHAFFGNLPLEWMEGSTVVINHLRPVTSVAGLRIAFRILSPLLHRLVNAHNLFMKALTALLNVVTDVFGRNNSSQSNGVVAEASEIVDIIDFLHHIVHYDGQGGPVQGNSKPRADVIALIGRIAENWRPDLYHLVIHLTPDPNSSIYAAAAAAAAAVSHPKFINNSS